MTIEWREETDDYDNTMWTADSPYLDEGTYFKWCLRQRYRNNRIFWIADHDHELGGDWDDVEWDTLEEAKASVQEAHDRILFEIEDLA